MLVWSLYESFFFFYNFFNAVPCSVVFWDVNVLVNIRYIASYGLKIFYDRLLSLLLTDVELRIGLVV